MAGFEWPVLSIQYSVVGFEALIASQESVLLAPFTPTARRDDDFGVVLVDL